VNVSEEERETIESVGDLEEVIGWFPVKEPSEESHGNGMYF